MTCFSMCLVPNTLRVEGINCAGHPPTSGNSIKWWRMTSSLNKLEQQWRMKLEDGRKRQLPLGWSPLYLLKMWWYRHLPSTAHHSKRCNMEHVSWYIGPVRVEWSTCGGGQVLRPEVEIVQVQIHGTADPSLACTPCYQNCKSKNTCLAQCQGRLRR